MSSTTKSSSGSPSSRASLSPVPMMHIVNEHVEMQSTGRLHFVHTDHLQENLNAAGERIQGLPQARTRNKYMSAKNLPAYRRGGVVANVSSTADGIGNGPGTGPLIWSMMICDAATCEECFPDTAKPGIGTSRGLPVVHSSSLYATPPPNSMPTGDGLFFREDWSHENGADNVVVTACEKKIVKFEQPVGQGSDQQRGDIIDVACAVCIPAHCSVCRPGFTPSPESSPAPTSRSNHSDTSMRDNDSPSSNNTNQAPKNDRKRKAEDDTDDSSRPQKKTKLKPEGPPPIEGTDGYACEGFTNSRQNTSKRRFEYLVKWRGYPGSDNTWEPIEHVLADPAWMRTYHEDWPEAPRPTAAQAARYGITHLCQQDLPTK